MAYEQTIAGKLEALPLPDMADAIWARIEAQLDLDLPTDDGPGGNAPNFPTGGFFIGGLGLVVLAVFLYFFSSSKNNAEPVIPNNNPTTQTLQNTEPANAKPPDKTGNNGTQINATNPADLPFTTVTSDSIGMVAQPVASAPDSAVMAPPLVTALPPATPAKTDTVPQKKPRGAQGISDDDYRIAPKKDSSKN